MKTIALDVRFRVVSGSSISIQNLSRAMLAYKPPGLRFITVRYRDQDLIPELAELQAVYAPETAAPLELAWNELRLPGLLRRAGADLYHGMKQCAPVRGLNCPCVHTVDAVKRGSDDDLPLSVATKLYYALHACRVYKHSEHLLPVSEHVGAFLRDDLAIEPSRVTVVHNGVGGRFLDAGRSRPPSPTRPPGIDQPYVICVGSIIPLKNQLAVVSALARIADRVPHHLVLIGREDETYARQVRDAARAGDIEPRVHWAGFVDEDGLIRNMLAADAMVHVSRTEGFCLATCEAMACGLPLVVTDRGALREQIADAALYLDDPDDHDTLADLMLRVLTDADQHEKLRQLGLERAAKYTWSESARQVLEVYQSLLSVM